MLLLSSSQSTPLDYYGPHKSPLHSFGGYATNFPPVATSLARPTAKFETSTTRRDYTTPCLPTAQETTASGQVFLGRSGFSVNKALHLPTRMDILRARRDQASDFYSLKSKLSGDCTIPNSLLTETYERHNPNSLSYDRCGPESSYWISAPGSRESGFTNCYSSINPVYWRQHDSTMDQLNNNELRSNAASVSQVDYQPYDLVNYENAPISGIMKLRSQGTGYRTTKELAPCFLPEPCIYSHHTPSFIDTDRFETMYNRDYKHRATACSTKGLEMLSSGVYKPKPLSNEESANFPFPACGPPRTFLSETRESFFNHWPLEGQRTLGLANPISKVSQSGFTHTVKNHSRNINPCEISMDTIDTSPQRYDPWPRYKLGHEILIDKNYRPNPIRSGIDYVTTNALPTTSDSASVFLY